MVYPMSVGTG